MDSGSWAFAINAPPPFAPWQNGRIERFFGTFKALIRQWNLNTLGLQEDLDRFRLWYNHIRPHQNLGGLTPAHFWSRTTPSAGKPPRYFSEWDGLLTGFYFPS